MIKVVREIKQVGIHHLIKTAWTKKSIVRIKVNKILKIKLYKI